MMKKIILTIILLASMLQAESVLLKLPYGLEIGKKVTPKAMNAASCRKKSSYSDCEVRNRVRFYISDDEQILSELWISGGTEHLPNSFYYGSDNHTKLPKLWRNLGLSIDSKGSKGTQPERFKEIIEKEGATNIYVIKDDGLVKINFVLENKYQYKTYFDGKDRLWLIMIKQFTDEDY